MIQSKITEVTPAKIQELVKEYQGRSRWLQYLQDYYEAHHSILKRDSKSLNTKENNKLVSNYPGYIVDVNTGYFMGKPVTYSASADKEKPGVLSKIVQAISPDKTKEFLHELTGIFTYNDEQDKNIINTKRAAIKGTTYELVYIDDESMIRFSPTDPVNSFMVYSTKVEPEPALFVYFWTSKEDTTKKDILHVLAYDDKFEYKFEGGETSLKQIDKNPHPFGIVPAIEYPNNDERQGDFEKVITLIDAYDKATSDAANDLEYFSDAFLKLKNMSGTTEEDLQRMIETRTVLVDADGDADWMVKQTSDVVPESHKTRLKQDIFSFAMTPDMADENFGGNVTGIGMAYRLWALEQSIAQKERKFKRGLQRRIELIVNYMKVHKKTYEWRDIEIAFTRNVPPVLGELVEAVTKLRGFVSDTTLLGWLPAIDDPEEEQQRIKEQREAEMEYSVDLSEYEDDDDDDEEVTGGE